MTEKKRDYKAEYADFHGLPAQMKARAIAEMRCCEPNGALL